MVPVIKYFTDVKIYSEEGARDIFALDHHVHDGSQSDVLDYEPHTTITDVEVIPIPLVGKVLTIIHGIFRRDALH